MSDEFRNYREPGNSSIHIHIDPDPSNMPNIPIDANGRNSTEQPTTMNSHHSSSFHTMFNRVRQHTNLNNVLTPNALMRTLISNSNLSIQGFQSSPTNQGFRYTPLINPILNTNNSADNVHVLLNAEQQQQRTIDPARSPLNLLRGRHENDLINHNIETHNSTQTLRNERTVGNDANPADDNFRFDDGAQASPAHARPDEDNNNNVFSDVLVRFLGNFIRYLPFLVILFVKFIHDHLLGILDIAVLQIVMWFVNKSLNQQVSKLSHKNTWILLRDMGIIAATITYRFLLASSSPDPLGLLINPPTETLTVEVSSSGQSAALNVLKNYLNTPNRPDTDLGSSVRVTKAISLGLLVYYVVVNDLILKLLTIWTKIVITMLPSGLLRHSQRARSYVLVEYFSQFYRSLVPVRQWGTFLFESYSGLEVISGILFAAFYMGAKGFELASRGKVLKEALVSFIRNMDYERKPTKAELETAGLICPICHDSYNTPVILTCNHIFCDDCVGQWFKREQTCPMCRAKVSDDPHWQDGSTTFFYQLC